jgi:hypothetical protein
MPVNDSVVSAEVKFILLWTGIADRDAPTGK